MSMTPDEWLASNHKKPCQTEIYDVFRYWGSLADYEPDHPDNEPDELDWLLPVEVYDRMNRRVSYPRVKMYLSEEEAVEDFRQAFLKAVEEGWQPS